jgi:hypothetical protein
MRENSDLVKAGLEPACEFFGGGMTRPNLAVSFCGRGQPERGRRWLRSTLSISELGAPACRTALTDQAPIQSGRDVVVLRTSERGPSAVQDI